MYESKRFRILHKKIKKSVLKKPSNIEGLIIKILFLIVQTYCCHQSLSESALLYHHELKKDETASLEFANEALDHYTPQHYLLTQCNVE